MKDNPSATVVRSNIEQQLIEIAGSLPGYEPRPAQVEMARVIDRTIRQKGHAVIEAGTGSGKSLAYLAALIRTGGRAVISTGTIALQEQLLQKDIPFVLEAAGLDLKVALAKGRGNYACLRRLEEMQSESPPGSAEQLLAGELLDLHREGHWSGDRADLDRQISPALWSSRIGYASHDCTARGCPYWEETPHQVAYRRLAEADLIVANHSLYLANAAMGGVLLPDHDVVVFDEAHQLERAACSAFDVVIERGQTGRILETVRRRCKEIPGDFVTPAVALEDEIADAVYSYGEGHVRLRDDPGLRSLFDSMASLIGTVSDLVREWRPAQQQLPGLDPAHEQSGVDLVREQTILMVDELASRWAHHSKEWADSDEVRWLESRQAADSFILHAVPLRIDELLDMALWSAKTAILTSATLAAGGDFSYYRSRLGLPSSTLEAVLESPFDFDAQARLYVPENLPMPDDPSFHEAAAAEVRRILAVSRGRAFILCTSYRSLRLFDRFLRDTLPFPVKTQEDLPRSRLLHWFQNTPNAVLIATSSYWEGIDVAGEALSCVIIDRIPFSSPEDPVTQARTELMKARGENWFQQMVLPRAILTLKQGFGRLIRTRTDTGLVAILDRRLLTRSYGRQIVEALPPARIIERLPASLEVEFGALV